MIKLELPNELWFQQDSCPTHNLGPASEFLQNAFPRQVIGTHTTLSLPTQSPDLSLLNYFLWGHVKSVTYHCATPFLKVDDLWEAIERVVHK